MKRFDNWNRKDDDGFRNFEMTSHLSVSQCDLFINFI